MAKRKRTDENEKNENEPRKSSTLFVSNIPFTATSTDLSTLFSDLAPVRSAFIVKDKEHGGVSKGVGYVNFAIREDAEAAYQRMKEGEQLKLDSRVLSVEWADNRKHASEKSTKKPRTISKPKRNDSNAIRTLVISNLPVDLTSNQLWKKIRKFQGAESIVFPVEDSPGTAHAVFATHAEASRSLPKLHAHTYKGTILSVILKKKLDSLPNPSKAKGGRLIVRNLPFAITETDLRRAFTPYGPIQSVTIPNAEGRGKGFAFVGFLSRQDAATAIEAVNGSVISVGATSADADSGRTVAVDWALSKDRWERENEREAVDGEDESIEQETADAESDEDKSTTSSDDDRAEGGANETDEDKSQLEGEDGEDEEPPRDKPKLPEPSSGTTLFIRNVPYETTKDELRTLFKIHGPLRYAVLTMDHATGRPRGTAFVCFWNKEDADKVLAIAEQVRSLTVSGTDGRPVTAPKKNPFTLLAPDPSSESVSPLVLHGRTLDVTRAVDRENAAKLEEEGELRRRKADKRNLYLLKECLPNPQHSGLDPKQIEDIQASYRLRKRDLDSNPLLFVSKTRLSIRGLAKWITETVLRNWVRWMVKMYEEEVAKGAREAVKLFPEDADDTKKQNAAVKQSKILRDATHIDHLSGKGKSKGIAFVEMFSHGDALRIVKWYVTSTSDSWEKSWDKLLELSKEDFGRTLQALEKSKSTNDESKERIKALKAKITELSQSHRTNSKDKNIIVEFAVENIQVVRSRAEKVDRAETERREGLTRIKKV